MDPAYSKPLMNTDTDRALTLALTGANSGHSTHQADAQHM